MNSGYVSGKSVRDKGTALSIDKMNIKNMNCFIRQNETHSLSRLLIKDVNVYIRFALLLVHLFYHRDRTHLFSPVFYNLIGSYLFVVLA